MPFATHDGVRIHYEVEGEGPPLLLHHGFTSQGDAWRLGYVQVLRAHHRVVMIDARGHGDSSKPHDPADYAMEQRVRDVTAVLDALGIERTHYLGYSMGGRVGYAMACHAPQRLLKLAIGGAHPYPDERFAAFATVDGSDVAGFVAALEHLIDEPVPELMRQALRTADLRAYVAAARALPSMEHALACMTMPCLLFCGDRDARRDAVRRCADSLPHAEFLSLAGLNHMTCVSRSDRVLPHLLRFFG